MDPTDASDDVDMVVPRERRRSRAATIVYATTGCLALQLLVALGWFDPPTLPVATLTSAAVMLAAGALGALVPWIASARRKRSAHRRLAAIEAARDAGLATARLTYPGVRDFGDAIEIVEENGAAGGRARRLAIATATAVLTTFVASPSPERTSLVAVLFAVALGAIAASWQRAPRSVLRIDGRRRRITQWAAGVVELDVPIGAVHGLSLRQGLQRSPLGPTEKRWVEMHTGSLGAPFRTAALPAASRPVNVRVPNLPEAVQEALGRRLAVMFAAR